MATKVWDSSDGDWSAAGSWDPNGVPVNNDDVLFPNSNLQAVTSGLDQSAVDLDSLNIEDGFLPDIGISGTPLQIGSDDVIHRGIGTLFIAAPTAPLIDRILIDAPNWKNACTLEAASGVGTHFTEVLIRRGRVIGHGSNVPTISRCLIYYRNNEFDAFADFDDACEISDVVMKAGRFKATFTQANANIYVGGGIMEVNRATAVPMNILAQAGGNVDIQGLPAAGNMVNELYMLGGFQNWKNDTRAKTIGEALIFPGARLEIPDTVTITAGGSFLKQPVVS